MTDDLAAALRLDDRLRREVLSSLEGLIPQMVRLNSALLAGSSHPAVARELDAAAALTSSLYKLKEALQ